MSGELLSFQVKNLRSIKDSGLLDLPPLSILIGENGSGKSSFMRFFQILQQSMGISQKGALSFYGDYVDFGSFKESIHTFHDNEENYIGFSVKLKGIEVESRLFARYGKNLEESTVEFRIEEASNNSTYLSFFKININDDNITMAFDKEDKIEKILINDIDFASEISSLRKLRNKNLVPICFDMRQSERYLYRLGDERAGRELLVLQTKKKAGARIGVKKLNSIFKVPYDSHADLIKNLQTAIDSVTWKNSIANLSIDDKWYKEFRAKLIFSFITPILMGLRRSMEKLVDSIYYVGPVRATAQRYYRLQELDVSKIDPSGLNVPTFINSLSNTQLNDFIEWVNRYFHFKPFRERRTGHTAIGINDLPDSDNIDKKGFNLADMGFGYSQVLPILLQLWNFTQETGRSRRRKEKIFLIEQPELHLHPAFQVKLVQAFIDAVNVSQENKSSKVKLIIETHSQTIINALGRAVEDEKINHNDIAIYIFDKKEGCCSIKKSTFKQNGLLEEWPYGFFSGE
ncbi:DUF3696 domain-containing protein [Desulfovibrio litoralis]|uniref:AAA domain-containing protein, putative AbiEii toxin, Type IV TA system n=1 Tax=Desulfovibrio litoralis DSM 11393 TaxID=1121455 RepID=A0A1M7TNY8_9BACT|nr:AAA family ATPase [Desulfovibrio litoralis]SHN72447.1 AAA domain-containing protein, putative AbiEii toxin, Type IV TA system [Desulfovibrio litoralis DSM 11393]